jgi:hypothetical protein
MKYRLLAALLFSVSMVNMAIAKEMKKQNSFGDKTHKYSSFKKNSGQTRKTLKGQPEYDESDLNSRELEAFKPILVETKAVKK